MNTSHPTGLPSRALRSGMALLLGAAAVVACEGEDPMTSPGDVSPAPPAREVITTEAAPVGGTFTVEIRAFDHETGCSPPGTEVFTASGDPPTYTLPTGVGSAYCILVELTSPLNTGGTLSASNCVSKDDEFGFNTSSTACTEHQGSHWRVFSRQQSAEGLWAYAVALPDGGTQGIRLQYQGRGSGVKNETLPPFDVTRPLD